MNRLGLALKNEIKLFRTTIPIHLIAFLQPTVMFLLMSTILVHPTFDMYVKESSIAEAKDLVTAMREVGSPIGFDYINPIILDQEKLRLLTEGPPQV